jgi:hypothetical protein
MEFRSLLVRSSADYLHSSALAPFTTLSMCLRSTSCNCTRADIRPTVLQCTFNLNHTSVAIERTSKLLYSCTLMINHPLPTLERFSIVNSNKPEAAKYSVFNFFLFYSYFSLSVYFLCLSFIFSLLLSIFVSKSKKKKKSYCFMCAMLNSEGEA